MKQRKKCLCVVQSVIPRAFGLFKTPPSWQARTFANTLTLCLPRAVSCTGGILSVWGITHEGRHQGNFSAVCRSRPNLWIDKVTMTSFLWLIKKVGACLIVAFFFFWFSSYSVPFLVGPSQWRYRQYIQLLLIQPQLGHSKHFFSLPKQLN